MALKSDKRWPLNARYGETAMVCDGTRHLHLQASQDGASYPPQCAILANIACDGWACKHWMAIKRKDRT